MISDEISYKLLKILENNPAINQRELSRQMDMSLGKVNYCLKALIGRGMVKARNFYNNDNKRVYKYLLTPAGIRQKTLITARFLKKKLLEYEELKVQIDELSAEVKNNETVELHELDNG